MLIINTQTNIYRKMRQEFPKLTRFYIQCSALAVPLPEQTESKAKTKVLAKEWNVGNNMPSSPASSQ